jgi:hypothetical protein
MLNLRNRVGLPYKGKAFTITYNYNVVNEFCINVFKHSYLAYSRQSVDSFVDSL